MNGVHFHPHLPLLLASTGQRHYPPLFDGESSDDEVVPTEEDGLESRLANGVFVWMLPYRSLHKIRDEEENTPNEIEEKERGEQVTEQEIEQERNKEKEHDWEKEIDQEREEEIEQGEADITKENLEKRDQERSVEDVETGTQKSINREVKYQGRIDQEIIENEGVEHIQQQQKRVQEKVENRFCLLS